MNDAGQYTTHAVTVLEASPPSDWPYRCAMNLLKHLVDDAIAEQLAFMGETSVFSTAGSIVTGNVPANTLISKNSSKLIRSIAEQRRYDWERIARRRP
ncbi:hypothetical protein [Achromobacter agilis]|uniref:hypothetical protein n=1 Tax=Achromobacter agilis TaxID=1353888 RepID=UPI0010135CD5|nr:hypothetical protein [Achromobacter agilis]